MPNPAAQLNTQIGGDWSPLSRALSAATNAMNRFTGSVENSSRKVQGSLDRSMGAASARAATLATNLERAANAASKLGLVSQTAASQVNAGASASSQAAQAASGLAGAAGNAARATTQMGQSAQRGMQQTQTGTQRAASGLNSFIQTINRLRAAANRPIVQRVSVQRTGGAGGRGGYGGGGFGNTFLAAGAGFGVLSGLKDAISDGAAFENEILKLYATAGATQPIEQLRSSVQGLAMEFGQLPSAVATALYPIISLGYSDADAMQILRAAMLQAKGTASSLTTTSTALVQTLKAFGLGAKDAGHVTDVLTKAIKDSRVPGEQFVPAYANVINVAHNLGLTVQETTSALAEMTQTTKNAATASTQLKAFLSALESPTKATRDAAKELGLSWLANGQAAAEIKRVGLPGVMAELAKATGGAGDKMAHLFPDQRKVGAMFALLNGGGKEFKRIFDDVSHSAGTTQEAADKMGEGIQNSLDKLSAKFEAFKENFAKSMEPVTRAVLDGLNRVLDAFNKMPDDGKRALGTDVGVGALMLALLPIIARVVTAVQGLGFAMQGAAASGVAAFGAGSALIVALGFLAVMIGRDVDMWGQATQAADDAAAAANNYAKAKDNVAASGRRGTLIAANQDLATQAGDLQTVLQEAKGKASRGDAPARPGRMIDGLGTDANLGNDTADLFSSADDYVKKATGGKFKSVAEATQARANALNAIKVNQQQITALSTPAAVAASRQSGGYAAGGGKAAVVAPLGSRANSSGGLPPPPKSGKGGGYNPAPVFTPESQPILDAEGAASDAQDFGTKIEAIAGHFAKLRYELTRAGKTWDEFSFKQTEAAQKMALADRTFDAATGADKNLEARKNAAQAALDQARKDYNQAAAAVPRGAGVKVSVEEKQRIQDMRRGVSDLQGVLRERTKAYQDNERLISESARAGAEARDEYAKNEQEQATKAQEKALKSLQTNLAQRLITRAQYEAALKALIAGGKVDGQTLSPEDTARLQGALDESATTRGTGNRELDLKNLRQASANGRGFGDIDGQFEAQRQELAAEVQAMRDAGLEETKITDYESGKRVEIERSEFEARRKYIEDYGKDLMDMGQLSQKAYRDYLVQSLEAVKKEYGDTSAEAAKLYVEILRLDWSAVAQRATDYHNALEQGKISTQEYILSLQDLQANLPKTSEEYKSLAKDIESANKDLFDKAKQQAQEASGRIGDVFMSVLSKAKTAKQAIRDALKDAFAQFEKQTIENALKNIIVKFETKKQDGEAAKAAQMHVKATVDFGAGVTAFADGVNTFGDFVKQFVAGASGGGGTSSGMTGASIRTTLTGTDAALQGIHAAQGAKGSVGQATADVNAANAALSAAGIRSTQTGTQAMLSGISSGVGALQDLGQVARMGNSGFMKSLSAASPYIGLGLAALQLFGMFGSQKHTPTKIQDQQYAHLLTDFSSAVDSHYSGADGMRSILAPETMGQAGVHGLDASPGGSAAPVMHFNFSGSNFIGNDAQAHAKQIADMVTAHVMDNISRQTTFDNARRGTG